MGTVTLMDFTCVARPVGSSALSHAGLLFHAVSKLWQLMALFHFPLSAEGLHLIPPLPFLLSKMSHLPLELRMNHNPKS